MKVYALYHGWVQGEISGIQINGKNYSASQILTLEADNAAQAARIKELEAALDSDPSGSDLWRYWSRKACEASQKYVDEVDRAEALEAKLAAAEKALNAIAHTFTEDSHGNMKTLSGGEYQAMARAVLGGKPS